MNLMKHNLVERGLAEYKAGLLYLLGRILRRGKGNSYHPGIRRLYQAEAGGKSTTIADKDEDKDKEEDDEDDLTLLINSAKFDIGRATEVGSLGVGK